MSELDSNMWDREDLEQQSHVEQEYQEDSDLYEEDEYEDEYEDEDEDFDMSAIDDDLFEEDESLIDEAVVRLEQGRLYQMLINHDLFDGVEAEQQVVDKVQKEIKGFIKERLQILVGMKSEKEEVHIIQESIFNDLEVQVLKKLANKVSKGMTEDAPTTPPKVESELNTVKKRPKSNKINALGGNSNKTKPAPTPTPTSGVPARTKRPKQPAKKKRPVRKVKKEITDKTTMGKSATQLAQKDMKYIDSLQSMSKEQANEIVSQRHSDKRMSKKPISQDHVNAHYSNKMAMNETANTFSTILAHAKKT